MPIATPVGSHFESAEPPDKASHVRVHDAELDVVEPGPATLCASMEAIPTPEPITLDKQLVRHRKASFRQAPF